MKNSSDLAGSDLYDSNMEDESHGFKMEYKRKGSGSHSSLDKLKRKLSDSESRIPRKMSKKLPEAFDEFIYGNEVYPPIDYHM